MDWAWHARCPRQGGGHGAGLGQMPCHSIWDGEHPPPPADLPSQWEWQPRDHITVMEEAAASAERLRAPRDVAADTFPVLAALSRRRRSAAAAAREQQEQRMRAHQAQVEADAAAFNIPGDERILPRPALRTSAVGRMFCKSSGGSAHAPRQKGTAVASRTTHGLMHCLLLVVIFSVIPAKATHTPATPRNTHGVRSCNPSTARIWKRQQPTRTLRVELAAHCTCYPRRSGPAAR